MEHRKHGNVEQEVALVMDKSFTSAHAGFTFLKEIEGEVFRVE
jgi:hypothetical protein